MADDADKKVMSKTTSLSEEDRAKIRALKRSRERPGQVSLLIYSRDGVQVVPLLEGKSVVVGRSAPADVTVRDNSLSRQHACLELGEGEVWVEDLQSTNGTWMDGEKIERAKVETGAELTFGAVSASVHALQPAESRELGLQSHDRFQSDLEAEVCRARAFGRNLALMMLRSQRREDHLGHWFPGVKEHLRPFDRTALYSPGIAEILLPEKSETQARELADVLTGGDSPLFCGLGVLPDHASSPGELLEVARTALQQAKPSEPVQTAGPADASDPIGGRLSQGPAMQKVFATVEKVASSAIPVLIIGETGSGKEVVARAIHEAGKRSSKPMRCVNCGGIPSQLVESTLFGHEKGAFTGASQQSQGVFESADGGTVLLDEVGELPPAAQAALLRVLETKRFTRVGSNKEIEVDVRVLAATHRDLEAMVKEGGFREDLLYRLNAMTLAIPPLRDRPDEIIPLAEHFVALANQANDCKVQEIDDEARRLLEQYGWPGNVRELRNAIERAVVIAQDDLITVEDLPEKVRELETGAPAEEGEPGEQDTNLKNEMARLEAELILKALRKSNWDRHAAAASLGLPVRTLAHKMQQHGIKKIAYEKDA